MFDQTKIGHSFPPFTIEVERCKIRELALAIGDDNPIYHRYEAAQAAGYQIYRFRRLLLLSSASGVIHNFLSS